MDHSEASSSESGDDWPEEEEGELLLPTKCLLCALEASSVEAMFAHCASSHALDVLSLTRRWIRDQVDYIQMVNFLRNQKVSSGAAVHELVSSGRFPWRDDRYMHPEIADDPALCYDVEDLCAGEEAYPPSESVAECVTSSLERRCSQAEKDLQVALETIDSLREAAKRLVLDEEGSGSSGDIARLRDDEDGSYFDSYNHFSIHLEMLQDRVRTEAYRDAIDKNASFFAGKTVLDVGCGTGILSLFAARAGAARVIAVEHSDTIYQAMDIARENGLQDRICFVKGRMETVQLPVSEVDVIISEWMGYFLLFESMLDSVVWARDRYLREGGVVLPDQFSLSVCAISDEALYGRTMDFWKDVYGFQMSCMRNETVKEVLVTTVADHAVVSNCVVIKEIDALRCQVDQLEFVAEAQLVAHRQCSMHAVCAFFDVGFAAGLVHPVSFSTSPSAPSTHWKQAVFLLPQAIELRQGESVAVQVECRKNRKHPRSLDIALTLNGTRLKYWMD